MIDLGGLQITGVATSTILGIVLYQILPEPKADEAQFVLVLKKFNGFNHHKKRGTNSDGRAGVPRFFIVDWISKEAFLHSLTAFLKR